MGRFGAISLKLCQILIGIPSAIAFFVHPALAACGDEARVECHVAFETIAAITPSGDGFTVAGQVKGNPPGVGLLRFTRAGVARGNIFSLPLPADLAANRSMIGEPRKLIGLPNGDVVLLNLITITDAPVIKQVAWAARITPNDRILWNRSYPDSSASTIFHSGHYEASGDRLVLVGRRTAGGDPTSRCENWSQSLVMPLAAATGQPSGASFTFGDQARSLTNRQAIYDIVPGDRPGSYVIAGFITARHSETAAMCQDNMLVGTLAPAGNRWTLSSQSLGTSDGNELALAIRPAGDGRYLVAGQGRDRTTGVPAAQAYRVRIQPFAVEGLLTTPYPVDGSDRTGGDRYRVIVPLAERGRFLLAGSVSVSREAPNKAMWQMVSADLRANGPPTVLNSPGSSEILDAVLTRDGKVFAVGRWVDEGRNVGWTGFIGDPSTVDVPVAGARRPADSNLPRLSTLPVSNGMRQLPSTAFTTGAAYFERELKADSQHDFAFSIPANRTVKFSAYPESGDVDLVIVSSKKQPVAFSNFRRSATEFLFTTLPAGDYTLSIVVHSPVPAFELRIAQFPGVDAKATSKLERLSEQQRSQFANALESGGYMPPSNPSIALGGESVRAFLAVQEGVQREIEPGEVGKFIVPEQPAR